MMMLGDAGGLVLCHCSSGRKRGWWKPYCAACEKAWQARHLRGKEPWQLEELARQFECMRADDDPSLRVRH